MMEGRNWQSYSERYGYNGMEQDDYLKENNQDLTTNPAFTRTGTGNSYDYGARMYDTRVARFMSRDQLEKKHPDKSSYSSFANNPILYIDKGGEDYAIYVDHNPEKPTITIKACYFSMDKRSGEILNTEITFWNDLSDKFQYTFNDKVKDISYNIKFELTVVSELDANQYTFIDDKGPINSFTCLDRNVYKNSKISRGTLGYNINALIQFSYEDYLNNIYIPPHEIGHNLGMLHSLKGLMAQIPNSNRIWAGNIDDILGQAGVGANKEIFGGKGALNSEQMGRPIGPDYKLDSYGFFQVGNMPDEFMNGEVEEKEYDDD